MTSGLKTSEDYLQLCGLYSHTEFGQQHCVNTCGLSPQYIVDMSSYAYHGGLTNFGINSLLNLLQIFDEHKLVLRALVLHPQVHVNAQYGGIVRYGGQYDMGFGSIMNMTCIVDDRLPSMDYKFYQSWVFGYGATRENIMDELLPDYIKSIVGNWQTIIHDTLNPIHRTVTYVHKSSLYVHCKGFLYGCLITREN